MRKKIISQGGINTPNDKKLITWCCKVAKHPVRFEPYSPKVIVLCCRRPNVGEFLTLGVIQASISELVSVIVIVEKVHFTLEEHGVVVRAFGLYWGGIRFEPLSTHHCWSLSKSFISSLVVWSMTNNNAFGREKQNKKSNGEQSDLCDLEQVTLKPQLQTTFAWPLGCKYGTIACYIRKGANLENSNCLFGVYLVVIGKLTYLSI